MVLVAFGCGADGSGPLDATEATAIATRHGETLDGFERWAGRLAAAETTFASREAFEEAAFAPVRRERGVRAAWIERTGPDAWVLAHPARARVPDGLAWRTVRLTGLRAYEVAREPSRVLLRSRRPAPSGAQLVVTIAWERTEDAP